jgi:hypothetical protein
MAEVTETAVLCDTIILKYRLLIEFYSYEILVEHLNEVITSAFKFIIMKRL